MIGPSPLHAEQIEKLANALKQDAGSVVRLGSALHRLLSDARYITWFNSGRLSKEPFKLSDEPAKQLQEFDLSESGFLKCQVHRVIDEVFITDLPTLDRSIAAYPYTSESEDMHELIT